MQFEVIVNSTQFHLNLFHCLFDLFVSIVFNYSRHSSSRKHYHGNLYTKFARFISNFTNIIVITPCIYLIICHFELNDEKQACRLYSQTFVTDRFCISGYKFITYSTFGITVPLLAKSRALCLSTYIVGDTSLVAIARLRCPFPGETRAGASLKKHRVPKLTVARHRINFASSC